MKVNLEQGRGMDLVNSFGKIIVVMKECGCRIIWKGKALLHGETVGVMKDNGKITWCMGRAFISGQMVVDTKDSTIIIVSMAGGFSIGQMEIDMKGLGWMVSVMVKVNTILQVINIVKVFGI